MNIKLFKTILKPSVIIEYKMSAKNAPTKKIVAAATSTKKIAEPVVPEPVAAPAPVAVAVAAESKPKKSRAKAAKEETVAPVEPVVVEESVATAPAEEGEEARQRPKLRAFTEVYTELSTSVTEAYNQLQSAKRSLKSLQSAHNREVHNNTKTRESASRTPTIIFDQALVNYFRKRLPVNLLSVNRKGEHVDLSGLDTETRVHRTDVTQLYTAVFKHHKMQNPDDRRNVVYSQDADLVALLTTGGMAAGLAEDVEKIKKGTYRLTIFNIQRFTNQHLGKVDLPEEVVAA
jgi:hypothetical protein